MPKKPQDDELDGNPDIAAEELEGDEEELEESSGRGGCLGAFFPSSTPGCAAWLVATFLVCTVVTVWIIFWMDPDSVPWRYTLSWWRIAAIIGLIICIPWVVYKTTELWMKGAPGLYPDLDYAWRAGLQALESNGLSIDSVPIFLIIGSGSESQERSMMNATGMNFSIEGVPQGPAPIHWYANSEAIYLFCSDCSWTSALASLREEMRADDLAQGVGGEMPTAGGSRGLAMPRPAPPMNFPAREEASSTINAPAFGEPNPFGTPAPLPSTPASGASAPPSYMGTVMLTESGAPMGNLGMQPQPGMPDNTFAPTPGDMRGTLMFGEGMRPAVPQSPSPPYAPTEGTLAFGQPPPYATSAAQSTNWSSSNTAPTESPSKGKPVLVSHHYATACLQELQYLGQLIRNARQPLCPINGVLSLIQFESIHATPAELEELQKAIHADMETIQYAFQLRAPVSAVVVGLEKERGFRELVLRVGREKAIKQRFGRRFDVHAIPTKSELQALSVHVCGVFEDWAYLLFREERSLMRPGNTRLYELLAKVRCEWKLKLTDILTGGFGCEPGKAGEATSNFFSGCYFAATGDTADRQAFVKGIMDKLAEEQELIEWTTNAKQANQRVSVAANIGMILTLGLAISLCILFLYS